jgi:hypothetical protein
MQRGIVGGFADTGLRLRTGTRTQHHVPEIGLQRPKESPATGVPGGGKFMLTVASSGTVGAARIAKVGFF